MNRREQTQPSQLANKILACFIMMIAIFILAAWPPTWARSSQDNTVAGNWRSPEQQAVQSTEVPTTVPTKPPKPTETGTPKPTPTPTATQTPVGCPCGTALLDKFSVVSYSNNDGLLHWSSDWVEADPLDLGPNGGVIKVVDGELRLSDSPETGTQPTISRLANLGKAASATLTFHHRTPKSVDVGDQIVLEISSDGGVTFTTLRLFDGEADGVASFDISAYASNSTMIRFRVANGYGFPDEFFGIDNVQICVNCACNGIYADKFGTISYGNNDGTLIWTGDWVEADPLNQGPNGGVIKIINGELLLSDAPNTSTQPTISRTANLSDATNSTLTFRYRTPASVEAGDQVALEISKDGGLTFTLLRLYEGDTDGTDSFDISAFNASNTIVRFRVQQGFDELDEYFAIDYVEICTGCTREYFYLDRFSHSVYNASDGTLYWGTSWVESDPLNNAAVGGMIKIANGKLLLSDTPDTGAQPAISRTVGLTNAIDAFLVFPYQTSNTVEAGDQVAVEISKDGGITFTTLRIFDGKSSGDARFDLTPFIAPNVIIRFRVLQGYEAADEFFSIDNVQICVTFATPIPTPTPTGGIALQVIANPNPVGTAHTRETFAFNYQNQSGGVINNAKLLVTVPNNTAFNAAINPPGWSCPNGTGAGKVCTLNLGNIAPALERSQTQANALVLFVVDILRPLPANVTALDISGQIVDGNGATRATAALSVPIAPASSFQLNIAIEPAAPKPGGLVTITISYTNNGNISLADVILSVTVPDHSEFYGGGSATGWDCSVGSGPGTICRINLGSVAPGQHGTVQFVMILDDDIPANVIQISTSISATDGNGNTLNELRDGIVIGLGKSGLIIYLPAMRR